MKLNYISAAFNFIMVIGLIFAMLIFGFIEYWVRKIFNLN